MALQQNRILRFLMVLTAVLLTIFIYASYYSNTVMTLPTRMHTSAVSSLLVVPATSNNGDNKNSNNNNNNQLYHSGNLIFVDKQNSVNLLKIDTDLSNASYAQQYPEVAPSVSNLNYSRNILRKSAVGTIAVANTTLNSSVVVQSAASASSNPKATNLTVAIPSKSVLIQTDPLKGIRTGNMYETGHLDVNPQLCPDEGETIKLLILITSAPKNQEARLAIRQTWGHYGSRRDVMVAFVLGRSGAQTIEDSLTAENYLYGDLIRGNFIDSYNNLTLKTISILEWIDRECSHASYVLKTDDDMFINVPKLLSFIDKHRSEKRTIYGRLAKKWKPIRNQKSKYYVSPVQFSAVIFPQFTTGPAYLMTSDIVHDLYLKSLEQTYLKLEDVYTTGIVAQMLNIKRVHVNEFLNRRIAFNPCNIRKAISVHMIKRNEQFDLWKKLLDTSTKCK